MKAPVVVALAGLAMLGGCVTKEECAAVDWRAFGATDGRTGYVGYGTEAYRYVKSCRRLGVSIDTAAYEAGFEEGYGQFCTSDWALLGRSEGLDGAAPRDMVKVGFRCESYGGSADPGAYIDAYTQGARQHCAAVDWYDIGEEDAKESRGKNADAAEPDACNAIDYRIDRAAYDRGYRAAQDRICREDVMFDAGRDGESYNAATCDGVYRARRAFDAGEEYAELEGKVVDERARLTTLHGRTDIDVPKSIASAERRIFELETEMRALEKSYR